MIVKQYSAQQKKHMIDEEERIKAIQLAKKKETRINLQNYILNKLRKLKTDDYMAKGWAA
jgi:nicotinic acid mononucleotide adenylyltransferase